MSDGAARENFGFTATGEKVERVTISKGGLTAKVITWGAVIQDLRLEGHQPPLVLGFDKFEDYKYSSYFGATPGRNANRIGNGRFSIDGHEYQLELNEKGVTHLHGGSDGMGNSLDHIRHIMGESMEALIHHFKLVTEGFRVPPGQAYAAVESPKGELGCHTVSDGGTRPYRAHFRDPSFANLQALAMMTEGGQLADVVVALAAIDPVLGGVDR